MLDVGNFILGIETFVLGVGRFLYEILLRNSPLVNIYSLEKLIVKSAAYKSWYTISSIRIQYAKILIIAYKSGQSEQPVL